MADWLERAKREIPKRANRGTANSDERNLTAVTAVPKPGQSEISSANGDTTAAQSLRADDIVLSLEQWYPHFRDYHHRVVSESPDFDYRWLHQNKPNLFQAIKLKEKEIDALRSARLSQVMALLREWRELVLTAEFERPQFGR